jgi:hypothetical protein
MRVDTPMEVTLELTNGALLSALYRTGSVITHDHDRALWAVTSPDGRGRLQIVTGQIDLPYPVHPSTVEELTRQGYIKLDPEASDDGREVHRLTDAGIDAAKRVPISRHGTR